MDAERKAYDRWSEEDKVEAVRAYLLHGSYQRAGAACGVPWETIAFWKNSHALWWEGVTAKLTRELEEGHQAGFRRVLGKAIEVMERRLDEGDSRWDSKRCEVVHVPVSARDAAMIAGIVADKLRVSLGLPTRIVGTEKDEQRLQRLRELAVASQHKDEEATLQ